MPNYLYTHKLTGETQEVNRPIEDRNKPLADDEYGYWTREVEAPGVVFAFRKLPTLAEKMIDAHYKLEQRDQSRYNCGYSKDWTKKTWETSRAAEIAGLRETE